MWVNIGPGNDGLLPDSTKPLPEPIVTYHQWGFMAFIWKLFHSKCPNHYCTVETFYSTIYYSKYFIELNFDKSTQYVALWTHKRHPIPRPFGRAMECLLWVFHWNWPCYKGFLLYNDFGNYNYEIIATSPRGQWVKPGSPGWLPRLAWWEVRSPVETHTSPLLLASGSESIPAKTGLFSRPTGARQGGRIWDPPAIGDGGRLHETTTMNVEDILTGAWDTLIIW